MEPQNTQDELQKRLQERFLQLPKVVQDAITSTDVEKKLRELADTSKLHLDEWQVFENEIMLALLGFQKVEDLETNIQTHVGMEKSAARELAQKINVLIFEPIRQKLELGLDHPEAKALEVSSAEAARTQILNTEHAETASEVQPAPAVPAVPPSAPAVQPATPPPSPPTVKITRPSDSSEYKPGEPSATRKAVVDDPYRESLT